MGVPGRLRSTGSGPTAQRQSPRPSLAPCSQAAASASAGRRHPREDQINALTRSASGAIGFQPDSTRLVDVWFGDAMGHDPSSSRTINDAITALNGVSAKVLAINVDTSFASTAPRCQWPGHPDRHGHGAPPRAPWAPRRSEQDPRGLTNLDATVTAVPTCDPGLGLPEPGLPDRSERHLGHLRRGHHGRRRSHPGCDPALLRRTSSSTDSTPAPPSCSRSPSRSMTSPRRPSPAAPVSSPDGITPPGYRRQVLSTRGRRQPAGRHGHRVGHQKSVRAGPMRRTTIKLTQALGGTVRRPG